MRWFSRYRENPHSLAVLPVLRSARIPIFRGSNLPGTVMDRAALRLGGVEHPVLRRARTVHPIGVHGFAGDRDSRFDMTPIPAGPTIPSLASLRRVHL